MRPSAGRAGFADNLVLNVFLQGHCVVDAASNAALSSGVIPHYCIPDVGAGPLRISFIIGLATTGSVAAGGRVRYIGSSLRLRLIRRWPIWFQCKGLDSGIHHSSVAP